MPQFGKYDPTSIENSSTLFSYQEVPVTSSKVNRWNGNIAASFQLLHAIGAYLLTQNQSAVLTIGNGSELKAIPTDPVSMNVRVHPGWAAIGESFAGITETITLPVGGEFQAPVSNPRIDLIVLSNTGELSVVQGQEAASPVVPNAPAQSIPLAQVFHRTGATQILEADDSVQSYIIDARPAFVMGDAHKHASDAAPTETPDGSRIDFSTKHYFRDGTLSVFLNGVLQEKDVDYTESSDRRGYSFLTAPPSSYRIQHRYVIERESE